MGRVEMVIDSLRQNLLTREWVVNLKERARERYIPVRIGSRPADAISKVLQGVVTPQTADGELTIADIGVSSCKLQSVIINRFDKGVFHASLLVTCHDKSYEVKYPVGKALALAVGAEAPIFATEEILKKAGITTNEIDWLNVSGKVSRARILVVDDDELFRELVARILTDEGHEVDTAVDGDDALEKIKGKKYRLLITGIVMPRMDGFELYEHIKKIAPSLANKTIYLSGAVTKADAQEFFVRHKLPYMAKPFKYEQLKKEVDRILAEGTRKGRCR